MNKVVALLVLVAAASAQYAIQAIYDNNGCSGNPFGIVAYPTGSCLLTDDGYYQSVSCSSGQVIFKDRCTSSTCDDSNCYTTDESALYSGECSAAEGGRSLKGYCGDSLPGGLVLLKFYPNTSCTNEPFRVLGSADGKCIPNESDGTSSKTACDGNKITASMCSDSNCKSCVSQSASDGSCISGVVATCSDGAAVVPGVLLLATIMLAVMQF